MRLLIIKAPRNQSKNKGRMYSMLIFGFVKKSYETKKSMQNLKFEMHKTGF